MTEEIIREWLADYAALGPDELHTYANTVHHNAQVINAVFAVLDDRIKYNELVDNVCTTLFGFYRSKEIELKRFTLVFLPTLIYVYLNAVAHGEKKTCRGIEALLVGLYNLEAVDESCQAQNISFRLPSLAQASLYHEPPAWLLKTPEFLYGIPLSELYLNVLQPMSLAPASLTESALRRLEECNTKLVRWGPLTQLEKIIPQNRLTVMTALLFIYNQHISCLQKHSLEQLCKVVSKLVTQGFNKPGKRISYSSTDVPRVLPRIPVSPQLLLEILHSLYFSVFNGDSILALQAVEEVHHRACYQGYSEVMLVTNAIKNNRASRSGAHKTQGQITDNPMGISLAISPATTTSTVSKSMITNASFRTKKLPDDIPIQINKGEGEGAALGSISEEKEDGGHAPPAEVTGGPTRRSLPKMAVNFGKKTRERLSKSGRSGSTAGVGKTINGGDSWEGGGGGTAEDGAETDSGVGADSELSSSGGKASNNGSASHDLDSRTMQVSSV